MSKTFLVTGAGSGIGKAIVQHLASNGNKCILVGRNPQKLSQTLKEISGVNHISLTCDVKHFKTLEREAKVLGDEPIEGIIANAGIGGENHRGEKDRWSEIIETNLTGTYNTVNAFLPNLLKSKTSYKNIILMSSVLARLGVPNYSAYCASKAGLLGLMRSWANEFAPKRILVNAICPGWVNTKMAQEGLEEISEGMGISKDEFFNIAMQDVPLKKMSEPHEVAELVNYLLNQESMTGQTIDLNCGSVMNS